VLHAPAHPKINNRKNFGRRVQIVNSLYRVSQEECAILREGVPYVKIYRYNPKHLFLAPETEKKPATEPPQMNFLVSPVVYTSPL
jgi:hypothetical protein